MKVKTVIKIAMLPILLCILLGAAWCLNFQCKSVISQLLYLARGRTGTIYEQIYDGRRQTRYYRNGLREGIWRTWDKNGKLINQCEYRNGEPWDGVCQMHDMKNWIGEYKNGKPWKGYLPKLGKGYWDCPDGYGYFINGKDVDCLDYCNFWGLKGTNYGFFGLAHWAVPKPEQESTIP